MSGPERAAWMAEASYAVHTRACTYLLDDDGVCLWALTPDGDDAPGADRLARAQFVACLEAGGLVGELRVGATALLVCAEGGRTSLVQTPPIVWVEERRRPRAPEPSLPRVHPPPRAAPQRASALPLPTPPPVSRAPLPPPNLPPRIAAASVDRLPSFEDPGESTAQLSVEHFVPRPDVAYDAPPSEWSQFTPEAAAIARGFEGVDLGDGPIDEVSTYTEVTLTNPLYRAADSAPPARPATHRPGQRLR